MNPIKYPRTFHLPFSPSVSSDDKVLDSTAYFEGKEVVATVKLDGENTTLYSDNLHARSLDSAHHPTQNWLRQWHAGIAHEIPTGWRFCGEYLYAKHSILYKNLKSYFYLFSIWDENNVCLSWDHTKQIAEMLNIPTPTELYRGLWDENKLRGLYQSVVDCDECEGFVVRTTESFPYKDFAKNVAKFVRPHHVQTSKHWKFDKIVQNMLH